MDIDIKNQANYCLSCINKPCQRGCPLENDITSFIKNIKDNNYRKAYTTLTNTTILPSICGRICPHDNQCQGKCIRNIKGKSVEIGKLETFIGDLALKNNWPIEFKKNTSYNVAVVGGGPAGLTCAAYLRKSGIGVTIYEKYNFLGGIITHSIPSFRIDKKIVQESINKIINLGIDVKYNKELGKNITLKELEQSYDAIFIGIGSNKSKKMNIEGESLNGVYGGNELLEKHININCKNKIVVISGGGNVAIDVARTIVRKGAKEVIVVYRRSQNEMPADQKEVEEAKNENVKFLFQNNIVKINGRNSVEGIELIKTDLIKEGNLIKAVNIPNSNYNLKCDLVIMAIGSHPDTKIIQQLNLDLEENGKIKVNHDGQTSNPKVFSGGSITNTKDTIAWASRSGRDAAYKIIDFIASSHNKK